MEIKLEYGDIVVAAVQWNAEIIIVTKNGKIYRMYKDMDNNWAISPQD